MRYQIKIDGSAYPNGDGGWASVQVNGTRQSLSGSLKRVNFKQAEIMALIRTLQSLPDQADATIETDCPHVRYAWEGRGKYPRMNHLIERELPRLGDVELLHVPRAEVSQAHVLAKRAAKGR